MKTALVLKSLTLALVLVGTVSQAATKSSLVQVQAEHLRALKKAQAGDVKGALRMLETLESQAMPVNERDHVLMSIGRLDYEAGRYDAALAAYGKVDKTGPTWIESLEESAWALFRQGHPQDSIAKLKTVTSVVFKDEAKSEPYFLMGLAQLRVCDYKAVFKTIDLFKTRFGQTTKDLQASKAAADKARLSEIGETVQKLNLVEAETIQRLYVDENGKKHKGSTPAILRSSDQLSFPATDDDEFWLDEVDGYKVSLKGCVAPSESTAAKKVAASSAAPKNEVVK